MNALRKSSHEKNEPMVCITSSIVAIIGRTGAAQKWRIRQVATSYKGGARGLLYFTSCLRENSFAPYGKGDWSDLQASKNPSIPEGSRRFFVTPKSPNPAATRRAAARKAFNVVARIPKALPGIPIIQAPSWRLSWLTVRHKGVFSQALVNVCAAPHSTNLILA